MKKFLQLTLLAALLLPMAARSQNYEVYDFEDNAIPAGWTNNSSYPWVVTSTSQGSGHQGTYCIKSGNSGISSSTSTLSATFEFNGDGSISFLGGIYGEGTTSVWDKCIFKIDGVQQFQYGAEATWNTYTYQVSAGTHTFTWEYSKDGSVNPTGDAFFVDNVTVDLGVIPDCWGVKSLAVVGSETTSESITVSWIDTNNSGASYDVFLISGTDTTPESTTTDTFYTFDNLTPNTDYTIGVQANCGGGDLGNMRTVQARTSCDLITEFPWSENFETYASGNLSITCWQNEHISGGGTQVFKVYTSTTGNNSTHQLQLPDMSDGTKTKLVLPDMEFEEGTAYLFSIDIYRNTTSSPNEGVRVFVSNDGQIEGAAELGFLHRNYQQTDGGVVTAETASGWYTYEFPIPDSISGHVNIILRGESSYGSSTYMDNLLVMVNPSCPMPAGVSVSDIDITSATIHINDTNDVGSYHLVMLNGADTVVNETVTDTLITFDTLTSAVRYTVLVSALCDDGTETRTVSTAFHTTCETASLPWSENFETLEAGILDIPCWQNEHISGNGTQVFKVYTSSNGNNSTHQLQLPDMSNGTLTKLVLPDMEFEEGTAYLFSIDIYRNTTSSPNEGVRVFVSNDGQIEGAAELGFLHRNYQQTDGGVVTAETASGWYTYEFPIPDSISGHVNIILRGESSYGSSTYMDNLVVMVAPTCLMPTSVSVRGIGENEVTVAIVDTNEVGSYSIIMLDGEDTVVSETVYDTVSTFNTLNPGTRYTVIVRAVCDDGTETMPVSCTFATTCTTMTANDLPYTEDFEAYITGTLAEIDPCWTKFTQYGTGYPYPSASYNHTTGGNKALYFYSGANQYNYAVMPMMDDLNGLMLTFWTNISTPSSVQIQVGTMTSPNDISTFVPIYTTPSNMASSSWVEHEVLVPEGTTAQYLAFRNYGGSYFSAYLDDVTLQMAPSCARPHDVAHCDVVEDGVTFIWEGNAAEYEYRVTGTNNTVIATDIVTDTFVAVTGLTLNNDYVFAVRGICDGSDTTNWSPAYNFHFGYCQPTPSSVDGSGITNVTFGSDEEVVNNSQRPTSAPYYGNYTSQMGSATGGEALDVAITYSTGYTYGTIIWVDWNKDLVFGGDEVVYAGVSSSSNPTTLTASFIVPSNVDTGMYVMRIAGADGYYDSYTSSITTAANANPCPDDEVSYAIVHDYTLHVSDIASCLLPAGVSVSDIGETEATINIDDPAEAGSYRLVMLRNNDTVVDMSISDTEVTIDTLTSNTAYTVIVSTICSDGSETSTVSASFRTNCGAVTIPWLEDFEGYDGLYGSYANPMPGTYPPCYGFIAQSPSAFMHFTSSSYLYQGHSLSFYPGSAYAKNILILPVTSEEISGLEMSFWHRSENGNAQAGSLDAGYITNPADSTTFVSVGHWNYNDMTGYINSSVTFANAPEGARIAFRHNAGNASNYYWFLDDIDVHIAPICARPQGVTVSNITSTTADVTISDSTLVGSYMYIITDGTNSDTVTNISDTIISLTDLVPGTYYDIKVAAVCSDGNPTAFVSASFLTECAPIATLPWSENFEGWGTGNAGFHPCWSHFYQSGSSIYTNNYPYVSSSTNAHSGTKYMYNYTYQGSSSQYYSVFYLPEFDADLNTLGVSFFLNPNSSSYASTVRVAVGVSDSATADTSTFTRLATIAATQNAWEEFDADLSAYTGNGGRITFVVYGTTANYIYPYIDDITVDALADCRRPSVVEAVNITNNEATISWVDATLAGSYIVTLYDATGAAIGSPVTVTDTFYTFTGLTNATTYTVGVSSNCTNEATRERTMSFTTANCALLTRADLPLVETFDSYTTGTSGTIDNCWNKFSLSGTSYYPYPSSSYHHGTTGNSMYFYPYGVNRANYLVLPGYDTVANLNLRFWMYRGNSYAQIEVGVMTDPNNANTFTPIQAFTPSATSTWEEVDVDLNGYTGSGHFVALRAYCVNTTTNYSIYVDDITLSTISACPRPGSVSVSSVTLNSAVVTVNDLAEINNYRLWWGDSDSVDITTNTYTITGLSASSSYTVTVAAICPDGTLTNTRSTTFRTLCGDITYSGLPWFESFETYGSNVRDTAAALSCWSFIHPHGETTYSSNGYCYVTNSYPVTGTYTLRFSGYAATPMVAVLPSFETDIANLKMTFHLRSENTNDYSGTSYSPGAIRVGYITDPTDSTTFVQTARFECTSGLYTNMTLDSATFAGAPTGARIAIEQVNNNTNYWWWIDDITVSLDQNTPTPQYTVSVSSANATMGTASCTPSGSVDAGTSVTATATANDGYHFVSWTDANGGTVSTANPYTFTVTADVALTATFEANSTPTYYTVTVSSANTTMGTVSCTPSGSVEAGTSVTATATPANNHIFTGWVDANGDTVSRANPYTFTVTADVTLVGTFRYDGVGIDEAEVSNVSLFPNPATSTFTVSATGMKEATVIDLNGRTVMTQSAADGTATFDVSTLAKGTYFVRIVGEQATAVRKLVVK